MLATCQFLTARYVHSIISCTSVYKFETVVVAEVGISIFLADILP